MSSFTKEALLGSAATHRGAVNTMTVAVAFALSIMVINNYRQCEDGKGYPESRTFVNMSYYLAIAILVACCLLFGYDLLILSGLMK